jgi:hypothetical protein
VENASDLDQPTSVLASFVHTPAILACFAPWESPMKHLAMVMAACLAFASASVGQQTSDNLPASKEDVQRYLDLMHSRDTMTKMWEAMSKQIRQMTHEEYLKHKDRLPSDFEVQENRKLDEMIKAMPFEELEQAVVPVYQKHLTKADVDALIAFYSSPTGQKLITEMPAIVAESMQAAYPVMQKRMNAMIEHMQQEIAQRTKDSKPTTNQD